MTDIYFMPSQYSTEIVGEQSYQKAIREVAMYKELVDKDDMEDKMPGLEAALILENENKYDPGNAVRVEIEGKTVGYLAKEDAQKYRQALARLGVPNEIGTCKATAFGKRESLGKVMNYGIWLSIDINDLEIGKKPRKKFLGLF